MDKAVTIIGSNPVRVWGLSIEERAARMAQASGLQWAGADASNAQILVHAGFYFEPALLAEIASNPGTVLTLEGVPVIGHSAEPEQSKVIADAMRDDRKIAVSQDIKLVALEEMGPIENKQLRKRSAPFVGRLMPESVDQIERASYSGAYKGVTDILTKYLWPEWAYYLTRMAARVHMRPNQVTLIGANCCVATIFLFWFGHYWWGLATALLFMVLDTVDGKLARCTITSSRMGNLFDHGIDLVHPPFWWWAWAIGLGHWGLALPPPIFDAVFLATVGGYVFQRLIEGAFMIRNGRMHIHVWQPLDSRFRLISARRNPNMIILFVSLIFGRPDVGIIALAGWTVSSGLFHLLRLTQSEVQKARGIPITSWIAEAK